MITKVARLGIFLCVGLVFTLSVAAQQQNKPKPGAEDTQLSKPAGPKIKYLMSERERPLPFSEAVRVGHMLYLSGQIGTDTTFALVSGGIKAETKQTMDNIRRTLEKYGSSMHEVVKCTVMLADMSEWGAMNEVYVTYFKTDRLPARSALGVNGLALGARVEIECWATVR